MKYAGQLQQAELRVAEITILVLVQRESYPDEIAALFNKAPNETGQEAIGKQSSIYRLMPILDGNRCQRNPPGVQHPKTAFGGKESKP